MSDTNKVIYTVNVWDMSVIKIIVITHTQCHYGGGVIIISERRIKWMGFLIYLSSVEVLTKNNCDKQYSVLVKVGGCDIKNVIFFIERDAQTKSLGFNQCIFPRKSLLIFSFLKSCMRIYNFFGENKLYFQLADA